MPPDAEPTNATPTTTDAAPLAPRGEVPAVDVAPTTPASSPAAARESKVVTIPSNAFSKLKRDEREKGQLALAKELGFESVEAMRLAATRGKSGRSGNGNATPARERTPERGAARAAESASSAPEAPAAGAAPNQKQLDRAAREKAELEEKNRRLARDKARQEKSNRELRYSLMRKEAEVELKITALKCGVQDVDYAMHLLERQTAGKTAEELKDFDEAKFFNGLRTTHPYLFNETTAPATTGNATAPTPRAPAAPAKPAAPAAPGGGPIDARKMPRDEFDKLLAGRGLHNPNGSPSY